MNFTLDFHNSPMRLSHPHNTHDGSVSGVYAAFRKSQETPAGVIGDIGNGILYTAIRLSASPYTSAVLGERVRGIHRDGQAIHVIGRRLGRTLSTQNATA